MSVAVLTRAVALEPERSAAPPVAAVRSLVRCDGESLVLDAGRVAVLEGGRLICSDIVDAPCPRAADHPAFQSLRRRLLARLGVFPGMAATEPSRLQEVES